MRFAYRSCLALLGTSLALAIGSCRGATEILLDLRTNIPCVGAAPWHGVAVYTGHPGIDVETRAPAMTSTACDAKGEIGTLAVVPNGPSDAEIGIRVVAGITRAPEDCAAHGYEGCVVARRTLSFLPHQELDLTIQLDSDCTGLGCDALHSCANGSCADARVTPVTPAADAAAPVTGPVRCGDEGVTCPNEGETCCLTVDRDAGTTRGDCRLPKACPPTSVVLQCDANTQCTGADDAGSPNICCLVYSGFAQPGNVDPDNISAGACMSLAACYGANIGGTSGFMLCGDRQPCPGDFACKKAGVTLPGYFWCPFN
jgi:hypothetical protein